MAKTKFAKFLIHYALESRWLGQAIGSLSSRFMEHEDQEKLREISARFEAIHDNIQKGISEVDQASTVKVSKAEIQAAVKAELPSLILAAVQEERKKWDAEQKAKETPPA